MNGPFFGRFYGYNTATWNSRIWIRYGYIEGAHESVFYLARFKKINEKKEKTQKA